jgi:hypothetical protein
LPFNKNKNDMNSLTKEPSMVERDIMERLRKEYPEYFKKMANDIRDTHSQRTHYDTHSQRTDYIPHLTEATSMKKPITGPLILDQYYSDHGFAVYGDTRPHRFFLQQAKLRFQRNLRDGAGWTGSRKRYEAFLVSLKENGIKYEIKEKLEPDDAADDDVAADDADVAAEVVEETVEEKKAENMTLPELKSALRAKGLSVTGKKADLIKRLEDGAEAVAVKPKVVKPKTVKPVKKPVTDEEEIEEEDD